MKKIILLAVCLLSFFASTLVSGKNRIDLSGTWRFEIDRNEIGEAQGWYKRTLSDSILLPGSMVENLKGDDITIDTKFTASIYDSSWFFNPYKAKYRLPENLKMPFWLTQIKRYEGLAWYQHDIQIPSNWKSQDILLYLERPHYITKVWIDDIYMGSQNSLSVAHVFKLNKSIKPGRHKLTICVDNRLKSMDVGTNSHSVTDHTQGNWNGIVGNIQLQSVPLIRFDDIQIYPDIKNKRAIVKIKITNETVKAFNGKISLSAQSFNSEIIHKVNQVEIPVKSSGSNDNYEINLVLGDSMQTWDEFNPSLYKLTATLTGNKISDSKTVEFGMRELSIQGKYFYINGNKTMLRGTVENALFPLTGYPPHDLVSWERVFRICKSYGLNHVRFHSYCPPEAAFKAADRVGFYLQPEGPSWPNHSTQLGRGLPIDTYLMDETKQIVNNYGNYASFTFLACGNEPRGNWVSWVTKFVNYWKATDSRRLYTGASVGGSWAWQPANQYHVKAGARGLTWKESVPETMSDYKSKIDTVQQPYISHETGQWCAFPNFDEIKKYTGVSRAKNFELFREDLADNDMADLSHDFLMASGKLQTLCYKHEIEKTLRTPDYAGFQLLCLNDYSGQGTALVGVLDALWEEKGYVTAPEFRRFCNSTVALARMNKFVFLNNETLNAHVIVAHFHKNPIHNACIVWRIRDAYGQILKQDTLTIKNIELGNENNMGNIVYDLSPFKISTKLNLEVSIAGTEFINDWDFWVYPVSDKTLTSNGIYITDTLDAKAIQELNMGGKVLILAAGKVQYGKDVIQYYQPAFWNTSWFKMRPPHTTGVFISNLHPVFADFITENWGNMQWWELINRAQTMLLTDFPKGFRPIVQPIDTWFVNRKLGMLFEANVGKGKLLMTSIDLKNKLDERSVAVQLYKSIVNYMQSDKFHPLQSVPMDNIKDIFEKTAEPINSYSKSSPDELKKGVK